MASKQSTTAYIWDDESGEPCPMTIDEFNARIDASNLRRQKEIEEAQARNEELERLATQKEALLSRLRAAFDEASRESEVINARVAVLSAASRRARKKNENSRFAGNRSSAS